MFSYQSFKQVPMVVLGSKVVETMDGVLLTFDDPVCSKIIVSMCRSMSCIVLCTAGYPLVKN